MNKILRDKSIFTLRDGGLKIQENQQC